MLASLVVVVAMVAAIVVVIGVALDTGPALAATPTGGTIKATPFRVEGGQTGEAFAKCGVGKRAIGGGVVQSGSFVDHYVRASGPLDATGFTSETATGDVAKQWYAAVRNNSGQAINIKVFAICEERF